MGLPRRSTLQGTQTRPLGGGRRRWFCGGGSEHPSAPRGEGLEGRPNHPPPTPPPSNGLGGSGTPGNQIFFLALPALLPGKMKVLVDAFSDFSKKVHKSSIFCRFQGQKYSDAWYLNFFFALCNFFGRRGSRHLPLPARLKPGMAYGTRPRHSGAFGARSHDKASIDPRVQ